MTLQELYKVPVAYGESRLAMKGQFVEATKKLRERTGLGLQEAKAVIDLHVAHQYYYQLRTR